MNYQRIIIAGNATKDAKRLTSKNGDVTYTTLTVAVGNGRDDITFFPVAVFGKLGEFVAQYVQRGREVLVEGRVKATSQGRLNVVADNVVFGVSPTQEEGEKA